MEWKRLRDVNHICPSRKPLHLDLDYYSIRYEQNRVAVFPNTVVGVLMWWWKKKLLKINSIKATLFIYINNNKNKLFYEDLYTGTKIK